MKIQLPEVTANRGLNSLVVLGKAQVDEQLFKLCDVGDLGEVRLEDRNRERQRWLIRALGDEPGLWRDGARTNAFCLEPGLEVGVGQTTLIAEDERWMALRGFCARVLGWGGERRIAVDQANQPGTASR